MTTDLPSVTLPMPIEYKVPGCDAPAPGPTYMSNDGATFVCRCIVCARCGQHTGNATQGHYWRLCKVTGTSREFHLCCPGDCELEAKVTP